MLNFKIAETKDEFIQIHQLNYQTFVEEIPQHAENLRRELVDAFHQDNTYIIALHEVDLVGMVCFNVIRPFSLEKKGVNLDSFILINEEVAEVRLLSVKKQWRKGKLAVQLLTKLIEILLDQGIEKAFISATERELPFYEKIGFKPIADKVGSKNALYLPMMILLKDLNPIFRE